MNLRFTQNFLGVDQFIVNLNLNTVICLLTILVTGCNYDKDNINNLNLYIDLNKQEASNYLIMLPRINNAIDLRKFKRIEGGNTHNIYQLDQEQKFLLKVVKNSIGKSLNDLRINIAELNMAYHKLYEIFGLKKCLIEYRFISLVQESNKSKPENAIISIVHFDPAFLFKDKFGLNFRFLETDEIKINTHLSRYHAMNLALMGTEVSYKSFNLENYLEFEPFYKSIFKLIENESSLRGALKDFLLKFKIYYEKTGRFMDLKGKDNVIFYKDQFGWTYKIGSVIKIETEESFRKALKEISNHPQSINESNEIYALIFYVPSWVRGINALAKKLGMDKIIKNIILSKENSEHLGKIHSSLSFDQRSIYYAKKGKHKIALQLFNKFLKTEKQHNTFIRDILGTSYWNYIKNKNYGSLEKKEVETFVRLLVDSQNKFPNHRYADIQFAIEGLLGLLIKLESKDYELLESAKQVLSHL